jgi:hypothetical protein
MFLQFLPFFIFNNFLSEIFLKSENSGLKIKKSKFEKSHEFYRYFYQILSRFPSPFCLPWLFRANMAKGFSCALKISN